MKIGTNRLTKTTPRQQKHPHIRQSVFRQSSSSEGISRWIRDGGAVI
jgi:hypothetical protein